MAGLLRCGLQVAQSRQYGASRQSPKLRKAAMVEDRLPWDLHFTWTHPLPILQASLLLLLLLLRLRLRATLHPQPRCCPAALCTAAAFVALAATHGQRFVPGSLAILLLLLLRLLLFLLQLLQLALLPHAHAFSGFFYSAVVSRERLYSSIGQRPAAELYVHQTGGLQISAVLQLPCLSAAGTAVFAAAAAAGAATSRRAATAGAGLRVGAAGGRKRRTTHQVAVRDKEDAVQEFLKVGRSHEPKEPLERQRR